VAREAAFDHFTPCLERRKLLSQDCAEFHLSRPASRLQYSSTRLYAQHHRPRIMERRMLCASLLYEPLFIYYPFISRVRHTLWLKPSNSRTNRAQHAQLSWDGSLLRRLAVRHTFGCMSLLHNPSQASKPRVAPHSCHNQAKITAPLRMPSWHFLPVHPVWSRQPAPDFFHRGPVRPSPPSFSGWELVGISST
jgi:hypothetical protein